MSFRAPSVVDTSILRGSPEELAISVPITTADVTLTPLELTAGAYILTGAPTADRALILPFLAENAGRTRLIINNTTGPFKVTVKVTGQTGFVVEKGEMVRAFFNGTDVAKATPNVLSRRFSLKWTAGQRGKPGINADINSATEAVREIADPDFEILGTNGTSALSTFNAEGGITLTTDTGSADQMILAPHLDANQTPWSQVTWGTDQETEWEAQLKTGAAITTAIIWAGLKLTNTPVVATDAKQAFFRYEAGVNSGKWQFVYSINGVDTTVDTGITVAVSTVYHLAVKIDAARIARAYIDGLLVATSTALDDTSDFIPYVAVQTSTTAARAITVHGQAISRKYA